MAECSNKYEHSKGMDSIISYKEGDLFSCPDNESLAHCVSYDFVMGKGIAVLFKNKFGRVEELLNQYIEPGGCAVLKVDTRFIYYLVTKLYYYNKPTYKILESSLNEMLFHCKQNQITSISMPQIGSGLDRLDWKKVKGIIERVFCESNIKITVYIYKEIKPVVLHKKGDIFNCPGNESLVVFVSSDLEMKEGIEAAFKKNFGRLDELKQQNVEVGGFAVLNVGSKNIYYLVTRENYDQHPNMNDIELSLKAMAEHCIANKVDSISIPHFSLKGLNLNDFKYKIKRVFFNTDTKIAIFNHYEKEESIIEYKDGDIFNCPDDESLAVCISPDWRGKNKGVGGSMIYKFGHMDELKQKKLKAGDCAVLKVGTKNVYYLVTEENNDYRKNIKNVEFSSKYMKEHCIENDVTHISMSQSNFKRYKKQIKEVFSCSGIMITFYHKKPVVSFKSGNVLKSHKGESLAVCISTDLYMSREVAEFDREFGCKDELTKQKQEDLKPGSCHVFKANERFIYCLMTDNSKNPNIKDIEQSLKIMHDHCLQQKISYISMPPNFRQFEETLEKVFGNSNIKISVYRYEHQRNLNNTNLKRHHGREHDRKRTPQKK